jgi:hypothetical protein
MNEFYSALGAETVKSKFFHLFSMIEFCEREYKEHNGADALLDKQSVEKIIDCLKEQDTLKELPENSKSGEILSRIKKSLIDATDIGRSKKLLNILKWMEIDSFRHCDETIAVDEKLVQGLANLRNKSFHGNAEDENAEKEYRDAVVKLMYICEGVLNFVKKNEKKSSTKSILAPR